MKKLNLVQGSDKWKAVRLQNFTASEAPAMMNASKYMSRNELLKLKKTGNEKPISAHLQALFDKGHETEALARRIIEDLIGEDLYPLTGLLENTKYLASFDGLTFSKDINFEHKLWNETLAENIRNQVLEPQHYWQIEQQMLVSGAEKTIFVTSNGTKEKMEILHYTSIPERRLALIDGWNQFQIDLDEYEVEAIQEVVEPKETESFPVVIYGVKGTDISSNIVDCLDTIRQRSQFEINRVLETDQDFADKDQLNKDVKKARSDLKTVVANVKNNFATFSEFESVAIEIDSVLQKMQSHGEKQVKEAKEVKKRKIWTECDMQIVKHVREINDLISPVLLPHLLNCEPDFAAAMKNKRTIESLQNACDAVVADFKIEADQIANKVKENLLTLRELTSEHEFLFNDRNQLVTKDNEDLIAVIKTRISEHEAAEKTRLEKEREEMRLEEEKKAQDKVDAEKKAQEDKDRRIAEEEAEERGRIAKEAAERREKETNIGKVVPYGEKLGTELCTNCGDIKRIGYICECSMETTKDIPATDEDSITNAFSDWWEINHELHEGVCLEAVSQMAFEDGVKWALKN